MYSIDGKKAEKLKPVTFSDLGMRENDIEEILRCNIDMLCNEEESMLIIGQQVKNEKQGRSDLTAIDNSGSLVLIEIKRDCKDIVSRGEAFEFQAIRYAASYATIENPVPNTSFSQTIHKESGKTLSQIREEYMEREKSNVDD